jgi:hypothetical protein
MISIEAVFWASLFCNSNTWHLICYNFNLNFIYGSVTLDLGRQTPHSWGGSITIADMRSNWREMKSKGKLGKKLWFNKIVDNWTNEISIPNQIRSAQEIPEHSVNKNGPPRFCDFALLALISPLFHPWCAFLLLCFKCIWSSSFLYVSTLSIFILKLPKLEHP